MFRAGKNVFNFESLYMKRERLEALSDLLSHALKRAHIWSEEAGDFEGYRGQLEVVCNRFLTRFEATNLYVEGEESTIHLNA